MGQSQSAQLRSPVLTAIGLVNGNPAFLTPTESTSRNRSLKNLSQVIMSMTSTAVQNLVEMRPWRASGQIAELLVIYCFFIYTPFLSNSPTGQTAHHIFTLNGSINTDSCKGVHFLVSVDIAAHLGDQIAPKPQSILGS